MTEVNVDITRALASRADNWFMPLYPADSEEAQRLFPVSDEIEQAALDKVFGETSGDWTPETTDEAVFDIFAQFCRLVPKLGLVAVYHDPNTTDFHWARLRCVLAGAGYRLFGPLATILVELYPQCGLRPDETYDEWTAALKEAHYMCGWPIGLAWAEWRKLCDALPEVEKGVGLTDQWLVVAALFHVLKHMRMSPQYGMVITYRGTAANFKADDRSNLVAANQKVKQNLMTSLACPSATSVKSVHPCSLAVSSALNKLSTNDLLLRKPLSSLPGIVQAGPWSGVTPDPVSVHGFVQHGLRLTGVWVASDGHVSPAPGDTADVIGYDWTLTPGDHRRERLRFEYGLPERYDASQSPFDLLKWGFPNTRVDNFGAQGNETLGCLFDAVLCASVLRNEVPSLELEKPLLLCMPATPTLDESTNQGKSKCAHVIAQAMCPGIPLSGVSDTDSAPDQRAIASTIERFGSLCADEWRQPKRKAHILSHENLQLLITGGSVVAGKAFENAPSPLRLSQCIVASCKAIDAPPDIINRSLVIHLDPLSDEQRKRSEVLSEIESGKLSVRMRLSAIALCEAVDMAGELAKSRKESSTKGWRFNTLRTIAKILWTKRYGTDGSEPLDNAIQSMQAACVAHTLDAEASGLLGMLEEGSFVKVRLHSVFAETTSKELQIFVATCEQFNGADRHGFGPTCLLRARMAVAGIGGGPLARLMEYFGGGRQRVSDRTMAHALARDIRQSLPNVGDEWVFPDILGIGGWRLIRRPDVAGTPRVDVIQRVTVIPAEAP